MSVQQPVQLSCMTRVLAAAPSSLSSSLTLCCRDSAAHPTSQSAEQDHSQKACSGGRGCFGDSTRQGQASWRAGRSCDPATLSRLHTGDTSETSTPGSCSVQRSCCFAPLQAPSWTGAAPIQQCSPCSVKPAGRAHDYEADQLSQQVAGARFCLAAPYLSNTGTAASTPDGRA